MIRRPPRSTPLYSSAASDVYKRQIGTEFVFGRGHQVRFAPGSQLAGVGHADGRIRFSAEAAEGALAQVQRHRTRSTVIHARKSAGRASRDGGTGVLPIGEINLRPPARLARCKVK